MNRGAGAEARARPPRGRGRRGVPGVAPMRARGVAPRGGASWRPRRRTRRGCAEAARLFSWCRRERSSVGHKMCPAFSSSHFHTPARPQRRAAPSLSSACRPRRRTPPSRRRTQAVKMPACNKPVVCGSSLVSKGGSRRGSGGLLIVRCRVVSRHLGGPFSSQKWPSAARFARSPAPAARAKLHT